jgi:hypothetical protein
MAVVSAAALSNASASGITEKDAETPSGVAGASLAVGRIGWEVGDGITLEI